MSIGVVNWFNNHKGFGFITKDNVQYFVHYTSILQPDADGVKRLRQDSTVEFEIVESDRGPLAINVKELK